MIGKRLEKLAYVLVNHSFELNKNDLFYDQWKPCCNPVDKRGI